MTLKLQPDEMDPTLSPEQSTKLRNLLGLTPDDMSLSADELLAGIDSAIAKAHAAGFAEARGEEVKSLSLPTKYAMLVDADQHEVLKRIAGVNTPTISAKDLIARLIKDPAIKASLVASGQEGERVMASLRTKELIEEHNKRYEASAI